MGVPEASTDCASIIFDGVITAVRGWFGDDTRTNLKTDYRPTDNECPIARSEGEDDLDEIIKEQKIVKPRSCCIETAGQEQRRRLTGNRTYGRIDA